VFTVHHLEDSLWLLVSWPSGGRVAMRMAYSPNDHLEIKRITDKGKYVVFSIGSVIGDYQVELLLAEEKFPVINYKTTLTPAAPLFMPFWPRDLLPLNKAGKTGQAQGQVYANQMGARAGLGYFSLDKPASGTVFYFQNLTNLNGYCEATHTSAADVVGGQWPELGFSLPPSMENPLPAGKEFILSDAFVALSSEVPADEMKISRQFLDMMAAVYLHLPLPATNFHNWSEISEKGLEDLQNSHGCWSHANSHDYLNAYVSDYDTPPEIMVQLAVMLPLHDFYQWSNREMPAMKKIREGLSGFYSKEIGTVVRWLPAVANQLNGSEEQLKPDVMDSWYLHHPLLNLARLALDGEEIAKRLFLDSLDYAIKVAHHFKYKWPVFYNMRTLEVIKAETQPGKGGEKDVAGLYAHVMLQAHELTGDKKYLHEAEKAAKTLQGYGFELFYQANNTAFGANAMLRLWNITQNKLYLDLAIHCIANVFKNFQLWDCNYGYGKHYPTFFALFPLKDAKYTAAYEEQEVFAAFHDFLVHADDKDMPASVSLLIPEFLRYIVHRAAYYYPPNLPKEILSDEVKMGKVDPKLWIAIEDIHDGWEKSGEVGQEVYGAGVAFGIIPHHMIKVPEEKFMIYIDYPTIKYRHQKNKTSFDVRGDSRLSCRMVIIPVDEKALPKFKVIQKGDGEEIELKGVKTQAGMEYKVYGNKKISVNWK